MHKTILLSSTIIILTTLLIAVAAPSIVGLTAVLPIGIAKAQISAPPPGAPGSQLASLTDKWWQRILSTDITTQPDPLTTIYRGDCSQLIQGNTLFLVGQIFGTSVVNHGTCTISPQTSVLFPLVNAFDIDCQSLKQNSTHGGVCTFGVSKQTPVMGQPFGLLRILASVGGATNLAASLDGVPLQFVRVQSPPGGFEVNLAAHDVFGFNVGPVTLHGVADGFWVLLPSLPIGQHSLTFGGCLPSVGCQTNIYTLVVR
jgi:hypothetical protein